MNSKTIVGAIIGAVISFLLGYLLYGILLSGFFANHAGSTPVAMVNEMGAMNFIWIFLGNLCMCLLLAYVFNRTNTTTVTAGAVVGALLSALAMASHNFITLGTTNLSTTTAAFVDILVSAVIGAIAGAAIAWWLGRNASVG